MPLLRGLHRGQHWGQTIWYSSDQGNALSLNRMRSNNGDSTAILNWQVWLWYCRKLNPYELLVVCWVLGNWCAVSAALKHYRASSNSWSLNQWLYCTCISELTMTWHRFFCDVEMVLLKRNIFFFNVLTVSIQRGAIHASFKKIINYVLTIQKPLINTF